MYGCESWTIKKAECRRIDTFKLWCWRRLLRVPWTARRSNQSILKEIHPEYSLEGLMLKLKLQYFGHLMRRTDPLEKTLMLGKIEGGTRRGRQDEMVGWHYWLNGHEFEKAPGIGDGQGSLVCCSAWGCRESDMNEWLNWTELSKVLVRAECTEVPEDWCPSAVAADSPVSEPVPPPVSTKRNQRVWADKKARRDG